MSNSHELISEMERLRDAMSRGGELPPVREVLRALPEKFWADHDDAMLQGVWHRLTQHWDPMRRDRRTNRKPVRRDEWLK